MPIINNAHTVDLSKSSFKGRLEKAVLGFGVRKLAFAVLSSNPIHSLYEERWWLTALL